MTRRTASLSALLAVVIVVLIALLVPFRTADRPGSDSPQLAGGVPPSSQVSPDGAGEAPATSDGQVAVDLDDPTLSNPQPELPEVALNGEPVPELDGEALFVPASPRNTASALDFATAYYTIPSPTRTAEHRAALRPWVTDEVYAMLTSDPDNKFAEQTLCVTSERRTRSAPWLSTQSSPTAPPRSGCSWWLRRW